MTKTTQTGSDVIVIGAGLAGLTAAVHAVQTGATVRLIAQGWGQQIVTPGWISVCDRAKDDVIAELRGYAALHPAHPYALAGDEGMIDCLERFRAITKAIGVPYGACVKAGHNLRLTTLLGAIQTPLLAPASMVSGDLTGVTGEILLVSFTGWRDFYPALAASNLAKQGITARAVLVDAPGAPQAWDLWPVELARRFDDPALRQRVIDQLRPHVQNAAKIGFPAVVGLEQHVEALADCTQQLERPCFEIATLPPSVPGTRLSNRLRRWLLRQRARVQIGHPVVHGIVENRRCVGVDVGALGHTNPFYADQFILATGGLYNGGIQSDESGRLWEPIFDLPVKGPGGTGREKWYHANLLVHRGHAVHRHTGLRVNTRMQPLDADGAPVLDNVYAAGHLLTGFNPLTDGCAEGIALATALKAVQVALALEAQKSY
ncbi:MAG: anaerobic glycerol-3-phosphate dehydrogenase subunit B [Anaerolineae bacterium]|nr:anaerobic glycerol-3-phosphate dehydrogenase subunit B [Anaerolineae bacterium]